MIKIGDKVKITSPGWKGYIGRVNSIDRGTADVDFLVTPNTLTGRYWKERGNWFCLEFLKNINDSDESTIEAGVEQRIVLLKGELELLEKFLKSYKELTTETN